MNRAQAPAYVLLSLACASAPACGLNEAGVAPLDNTIAYPASAVMDKPGDWLFVTNANADLRYNDGTLIALSLVRAAKDREPYDPGGDPPRTENHPDWGECPAVNYDNPLHSKYPIDFCCRDALDPNLLNCDERGFVGPADDKGNGTFNVRIGSFAAGMVLQEPACPRLRSNPKYDPNAPNDPAKAQYLPCEICDGYTRDDDRLLIGVRGDTSLTYIDVQSQGPDTPPLFKCVGPATAPEAPGGFVTCNDAHRVITATSGLASPQDDPNAPDIPLPDEPYALAIDDRDGLLFIGHLSGNTTRPYTGGFSLFDIAPTGSGHLDVPRFIAPFPSPFAANSVGSVGVTSLSVNNGTVYATSRYVPQVAGLGTTAECAVPGNAMMPASPIREIAAFPNGAYYNPPLAGTETRGRAS